jgi:hypothetical protein
VIAEVRRGLKDVNEQREFSYGGDSTSRNQTRWKAMNRVGLMFQGFSELQNFDADVGINRLRQVLQTILKYLSKRL